MQPRRFIALIALLVVALPAHAQIFPAACSCPGRAPGYACLLGVLNSVVSFAVTLGVFITVLIIAYAGVLLVLNPTNAENKGTARKVLVNAGVGLLIVLASWLIINQVLKALGAGDIGSTTTSLAGGDRCIEVQTYAAPPPGGVVVPPTGGGVPDGIFTYQAGVAAQADNASPALSALLVCMAGKVPAGVGQISSITERAIESGSRTFDYCAINGCEHSAGSCHYGGARCVGQSYAVDFGDGNAGTQNETALISAAQACNANFINREGDHLHVSVGAACGCN